VIIKYSERVSGSHGSSATGGGGGGGDGRCVRGGDATGVSSGVGRTVAVAGVFGAGVLRAVSAGVF